MRNLIIIGAGGMGRSIYNLAIECTGFGKEYIIKGFIDDNLSSLKNYIGYPPVVGTIRDYKIQEKDLFVNSLGDVITKKICVTRILDRGGEFISLIHPSAIISTNVTFGKGCVVCAFASIGADANIGDFTLIQNGAIVGHDVTIGNWSRVDCYVVIVGGVIIGKEVSIHTASIINHNVTVNNNSCVGAGSFVIRNVKEGTTVFGNPAKIL
jgi:sugar O-acyltransferase (sialic acid O-acetyltransferase NeuD family)